MLGRIALRLAVVEALKGKTLVGGNVLDSKIGVLSTDADGHVKSDAKDPFIAVYTDTSTVDPQNSGPRALLLGGSCDLVIETGVASSMAYHSEDGEKEVIEGYPVTDDAFEMLLDIVARQIADALLDEDNAWSRVFQGLALDVTKVVRSRVGHHQYGTRLAAQEIRMTVELLDEPLRSAALPSEGPFADIVALTAESTVPLAIMLRDHLLGFVGLDADTGREHMGMSAAELLALGGFVPAEAADFDTVDIVVEPLGEPE